MKRATSHILFLLLFNLFLAATRSEVTRLNDEFGRKNDPLPSASKEADDTMIRRIEEEMLRLNKSGDAVRDKRALGILLQGFMEALGYTVAPIQLASLPNPSTMAQMPAGAAAPQAGGMMPAMMPGMMPPMMANASAPPRQRETLRITGLLNFGNSENTTNLINHLSQYENIFHGNRSAPASTTPAAAAMPAAPAPAIGPDIDPRYAPPLKEPLFVKIPLPIAPNLPPPQPPSPMPLDDISYQNEYYSKDNSEEYSDSKDERGQSGTYDEEDEDRHHSEAIESQKDKFEHFLDRNHENNDPDESYEGPKSKEKKVEKEFKNNKSVERYNVEDKEIHDPSEVDEEGSSHGSKFNHNTYIDEPNWKEEQDAKLYKIAAEQEARAEALAEENAEREKQKDHGHEEEEQFHRSREKEIDDANEEHEARYDKNYDNDDEEEGSSEKESYDEGRYHKDDEDESEDKEDDHEERGTHKNEARTQAPRSKAKEPVKNYQDADFYPATLPISSSHEMPRQAKPLRDSYGKSLEKPGGRVDERVAEYITMFKNPETGVYDPERVQGYEHARISFDHRDLIDGFNRIQKEYGSAPENKYEEYEIDGERVEHRGNYKDEDESKESLATEEPITECNCKKKKKKKNKAELQGSRSSERTVTHPPPLPQISTQTSVESTGYGPYYSTVNYMYDPLEYDHGIIARLTSYETPTTIQFDDHTALRSSPIPSTTLVPPTIPPERFTTMNFLHEGEAKGIQAWPAPFDYLYDNSEHKSVVYKKSPPVASSPAPFKTTRPPCNQHMMPFGEHKDKVKMIFRDHSGERYRSDQDSMKPRSFYDSRKAKPSEKINQRVEYHSHLPTTQATIYEQRKRPSSSERYSNYRSSTKPPTRSPSFTDILTTRRPERARSTKSSSKNRKTVKSVDRTPRPSSTKHRESTIKPTIKVKYTYPFAPDGRTVQAETTNYVEKDGTLVIPEPTPYYFHEGFEQFTEEPHDSNTERVQIKEYRNHIASVKVSELKQLHPEGSMQIFKYTRNL